MMKDITAKSDTVREAIAEAWVIMPPDVQQILREGRTEKGNALETARVAAIMGAKKTSEVVPLCHPIPITHVRMDYEFVPQGLRIEVFVRTKAPTGVEMEALTAATLAALTIYDMHKQYTHGIEIHDVRLLSKTGGKSGDYFYQPENQ
jgi:cyclic pyranopterin phosphate synthase